MTNILFIQNTSLHYKTNHCVRSDSDNKEMDPLLDRNIYEATNEAEKYIFWMTATSVQSYYFKVKLDKLFLDF